MEHKTLKFLRLIIPGIIILIGLIPFLIYSKRYPELLKLENGILFAIYPVIAIALGGIYHTFNFRGIFWKATLKIIQLFIKNEMVSPFEKDKVLLNKINQINDPKPFLNIHYHFIDKSESLTKQAEQIYFNGSLLTTMIDLIIICCVFDIAYIIFLISLNSNFFFNSMIIATLIIVMAYLGKINLLNKHLELVKNQIRFYQQFNLIELEEKLKKL